ncbi:hypothetical protein KM043_000051, partial [Ampulex compressa]
RSVTAKRSEDVHARSPVEKWNGEPGHRDKWHASEHSLRSVRSCGLHAEPRPAPLVPLGHE